MFIELLVQGKYIICYIAQTHVFGLQVWMDLMFFGSHVDVY
jgi:hypothetical protein